MSNANAVQIGGDHYKSELQHWDMCAANFGAGYFQGNASKYLSRWRKKNGVQDLEKALHYVEKLIELVEGSAVFLRRNHPIHHTAMEFCITNKLPPKECVIIVCICDATNVHMLKEAATSIRAMIREESAKPQEAAHA